MLKHILTAAVATGALLAGSAAFARDYDNDQYRHHYSDRTDHRDRDGDRSTSRNHNWSGNHTYMGGGSYRNRDYNRTYYHSDRNYNGSYYHHRDYDRDYDRGYYRNRGYHTGYYGYRNYVDRDRIFFVIREHNYRYVGDPYWYGDDYVVRAYDPYGRLVLVRVDPYTGAWLGVMFRL